MLSAFMPLMFFAYLAKLPYELQTYDAKIILLWLVSIVASFLTSFYLAVLMTKIAIGDFSDPETEVENAQMEIRNRSVTCPSFPSPRSVLPLFAV
jgi:hypothetical protein